MKIVLSRKGFDSEFGGMPSPIFPDGRILSLPIPSKVDRYTLSDLHLEGVDIGRLVCELSKGRHDGKTKVHLDPFLLPIAPVPPGWRPALGQTGAAQSHLAAQHVGPSDYFLFYG